MTELRDARSADVGRAMFGAFSAAGTAASTTGRRRPGPPHGLPGALERPAIPPTERLG